MFNSSALFSIGPQVEGIFGSQKFVFAYVATGVGSGVASWMFLPAGTAGASGAIFGLIGLMAVYGYKLGGSFGRDLMRQMLIWAGIGIMFGFFIGANNVAHVGGFVSGGALGFALQPDEPSTANSAARWNAAAIACIGLVAVSFVMAGRVYGAEQKSEAEGAKKRREFEAKRERGQDVILLAEKVRDAETLVFDPEGLSPKTSRDPKEISRDLRSAASEIGSAPQIDTRSTEIRSRLVELINKHATMFEKTGSNVAGLAHAAVSDLDGLRDAFKSYYDWEESVLFEYGLERKSR